MLQLCYVTKSKSFHITGLQLNISHCHLPPSFPSKERVLQQIALCQTTPLIPTLLLILLGYLHVYLSMFYFSYPLCFFLLSNYWPLSLHYSIFFLFAATTSFFLVKVIMLVTCICDVIKTDSSSVSEVLPHPSTCLPHAANFIIQLYCDTRRNSV